ncbi:Crp/Fnr family transcriptional regulator [Cyclobacterium sp.]|uniref:Crp/Fnr family transcriptional regulator n=1 Tax=Cyclobacterium sp. TaxID=1966343 RepID=UPI0019C0B1C1|nr:Crp/Fnr family transcriptional regulator [Cyclobacterium sp.]MBD3630625.1 Crp/Fnr family transcriptional regulator [Cyclobacterium sp.]
MEKSKIWFLENFSMFKMLSPEEMQEMDAYTVMREVPEKQVIYLSDDEAKHVYILKRGRVKISRLSQDGREVILGILGPGEVFGELSLIDQSKRDEMAIVTENALVCKISTPHFEKLMEQNRILNFQVTKFIGLRLKKIQNRLGNIMFKTSEQRIRSFIKEMAYDFGRDISGEKNQREIKIRLTHQEVGKLTAASRQTVTTVFNELDKNGIISYSRNRILVKDIERL